jgi:hypothetical protein
LNGLEKLASLIKEKEEVNKEIAKIIGRPAQLGHVGEYIASHIFNIKLEESASFKGSDGVFTDGRLKDQSVNIKWYTKREGLLDINPDGIPDYYLVLTGPKSVSPSSRGTIRPWVVESVYVFESTELIGLLKERGVKLGIASSVKRDLWDAAEIYPRQEQTKLILTDEQRGLLSLFG